MPGTILAAVDTDDLADDVLRTAREFAERLGDEVTVLRVASQDEVEAMIENASEDAGYVDRVLQRLTDDLERRVGNTFDGMPMPTVEVVRGEAHEQILGAARAGTVSMIVLGVHNRSRVGKLVFGSVAQSVLLQTPVPVLAVPPRQAR